MKDYKDTLNLPKTDFPMRGNLPKREPEFIKEWEEAKVYEKLTEGRKDKDEFVLHDGPPYSNNHIHLGQALNKILKDIVVKYHALLGYRTPYIPGWDNHGMPIENEVVKGDPKIRELAKSYENLKKTEVKLLIREKAKKFAEKWVNIQKEEFRRLGVLADFNNPYLTMKPEYEAKELEILADLVEQGYIYRSKMPIHWCPSCKTALAMAEIEYKDIKSPSLWFRMKAKNDDIYALVWTTTPWTIVSNVALAFHPSLFYVLVEAQGTRYILAEGTLKRNAEILKWKDYKIIERHKGTYFEHWVFLHPFIDRESLGILANYITTEDGTGIVHIAPGHGREDFEAGRKYNLPVISPVDEDGRFTEEAGEFKGLTTDEASEKVVKILKEKGAYVHYDEIVHSYPHCWRCKTPLIFRATTQWFLSVDHKDLRKKALEYIEDVKWIPPESINRISASITERPDWVISRQRSWGVPIPAIVCKKCGKVHLVPEVIRNLAKRVRREGSDVWYREPLESFLGDFKCDCGSTEFEKELNILDVWFDSGVSSIAVLESRGIKWPSDVYLEGPDQHRGWFNAAMMIGMAEKGRPPYKSVLTHGWVLDEKGLSMHKSLGNVIHPSEIINKYGAEILRLWASFGDYTEDMRLGKEILARIIDSYRKIRNTIRFMLGNLYDFDFEQDAISLEKLYPHDRYVLSRWEEVKRTVKKYYDNYEFHKVLHTLYRFVVVELSSLFLDYTKDRLYTWRKDSHGRRSAQTVMYIILDEFLRVIAPIASFTAHEGYKYFNKKDKKESVFLESWPLFRDEYLNEELKKDFEVLMQIRDRVLHAIEVARKEKKIISDRLEARINIEAKRDDVHSLLKKYEKHLPEFFIVSQVVFEVEDGEGHMEEDENVKVKVLHAKGEKCQRCWIWSEDIKDGLCPKCREVIHNANKS